MSKRAGRERGNERLRATEKRAGVAGVTVAVTGRRQVGGARALGVLGQVWAVAGYKAMPCLAAHRSLAPSIATSLPPRFYATITLRHNFYSATCARLCHDCGVMTRTVLCYLNLLSHTGCSPAPANPPTDTGSFTTTVIASSHPAVLS